MSEFEISKDSQLADVIAFAFDRAGYSEVAELFTDNHVRSEFEYACPNVSTFGPEFHLFGVDYFDFESETFEGLALEVAMSIAWTLNNFRGEFTSVQRAYEYVGYSKWGEWDGLECLEHLDEWPGLDDFWLNDATMCITWAILTHTVLSMDGYPVFFTGSYGLDRGVAELEKQGYRWRGLSEDIPEPLREVVINGWQ